MRIFTFLGILALAWLPAAACDGDTHDHEQSSYTGQKVATPQSGLQATVEENEVKLSDGRVFQLKRTPNKFVSSQVVMSGPEGAQVTIEYEDGTNAFTAKVPFVYNVPQVKNNEFFRMTVDEGGADKTWRVNLQHESSFILAIDTAGQ